MIILASETISKRNNYSVKIQCISFDGAPDAFYWFVDRSPSGGKYFDNFEDTAEYIKTKKLLTPKQLEKIEGIKASLLKSADLEIQKLQHIEDIRNTPEYRKAAELAEIAEQLMQDRKAQTIVQALKLLELASLQELSGISGSLDSIDAELTVK